MQHTALVQQRLGGCYQVVFSPVHCVYHTCKRPLCSNAGWLLSDSYVTQCIAYPTPLTPPVQHCQVAPTRYRLHLHIVYITQAYCTIAFQWFHLHLHTLYTILSYMMCTAVPGGCYQVALHLYFQCIRLHTMLYMHCSHIHTVFLCTQAG